jgi:hypothetical protein
MQAAANIDEVNIEYNFCYPHGNEHLHGISSSFLPYIHESGVASKSLKRFTFQHRYLSYCSQYMRFWGSNHNINWVNGYWEVPFIMQCIQDANNGFGCPGKLTTVYAGTEDVMDTYMWVAEEGKFLAPEGWAPKRLQ